MPARVGAHEEINVSPMMIWLMYVREYTVSSFLRTSKMKWVNQNCKLLVSVVFPCLHFLHSSLIFSRCPLLLLVPIMNVGAQNKDGVLKMIEWG